MTARLTQNVLAPEPPTVVLPPPTPLEAAQALEVLAAHAEAVGNKPMAEFWRSHANLARHHGHLPTVMHQVLTTPVPSGGDR